MYESYKISKGTASMEGRCSREGEGKNIRGRGLHVVIEACCRVDPPGLGLGLGLDQDH